MLNTAITSERLALNTLFNIASHVVQAAIAFFMVPFFMRTLGKEQYGIWILVASVFAYRNTLNLGLNSAINRFIPVFRAKNDADGMQRVISASVLYLYFTAAVLAGATVVVYRYIEVWFSIPLDLVGTTKNLVLVVGSCFAAIMPFQMYSGILSGLQRYDITSIGTILAIVLRTIALIVLLTRGYGLLAMGLIFGLCEIAIRLVQTIFALKLLPHISILPTFRVDFSLFRQMIHYGTNTLLYTLGNMIIYKSSDIVIGIFLSTKDITRYYVASAGMLMLGSFIEAFAAAIKPAISDLDARNKDHHVRQLSIWTQKYILMLLVPSVCFFLIMGRDFLHVWIGSDFGDVYFILVLLSISQFLRWLQHSNFLVLVGKGQHRIFGVMALSTAVCTVVLAVIFVRVFGLGLTGIALSNLIPMLVTCGVILPVYFSHKMNISITDHLFRIWLPALYSCAPALFFMGLWKYFHSPDRWLHIAIVLLCACSMTAVGIWSWGLDLAEKEKFQRIFAGWKKKVMPADTRL